MTVRMINIPGFGRNMKAVKSYQAGHYIYDTFQSIGKNGDRIGHIPGGDLDQEKHNGDTCYYPLNLKILPCCIQDERLKGKNSGITLMDNGIMDNG
jgi:hypothetical protein